MATYNTVLRQIAIAVNALTGAVAATLETSYATVPLTSANFQSSILPFTRLKDAMLNSEAALINTVLSTAEHPWRASFTSQTAPLAYGALIPATNAGASVIVGSRGAVRDSVSGEPCTKNELEQIRDRVINPNGMWKIEVFWYAVDDQRIYHTRSNVVVDVCTYARPVADSLVLTSNILLPDITVPAYVDGALMECVRDDEFMAQAERFGGMFNAWQNAIKAGLTTIDATSKVDQKAA